MVLVKSVVPVADRQWVMLHLESPDWDFARFGPVNLHLGAVHIRMRYIGWSNTAGTPVLASLPPTPTCGRSSK